MGGHGGVVGPDVGVSVGPGVLSEGAVVGSAVGLGGPGVGPVGVGAGVGPGVLSEGGVVGIVVGRGVVSDGAAVGIAVGAFSGWYPIFMSRP